MPDIALGSTSEELVAAVNEALGDASDLDAVKYPLYADTAAMAAADLTDGARAQVGDLVFERQSGDTTLPNLPGFKPSPINRRASIEHFGGVGDDATDNTTVMEAIKDYCTATGCAVDMGTGGTYRIDPISLTGSEKMILVGDPNNRPIIKLNPAIDGHVFNTSTDSTATYDLYGICLDGFRGTRSTGHGLRSAGCALIRLDQVRIQNCQSYGLGIQNGTTQRVEIGYLEIDSTGKDAIDIKDRDGDNGIFVFDHIHVSNHALDDEDDAAIDARGPVYGRLLTVEMSGAALGMRYRADGNGRAGFGSVQTVSVVGPGSGGGTTIACSFETNDPRAAIGEVIAKDVAIALLQNGESGCVDRVMGTGLYGTDAISLRGRGFCVRGGHVVTDASATVGEVLEITSVAQDISVYGLVIEDLTGGSELARIQSGATGTHLRDCMMISSGLTDNGIVDIGTDSIIDNVRWRTS